MASLFASLRGGPWECFPQDSVTILQEERNLESAWVREKPNEMIPSPTSVLSLSKNTACQRFQVHVDEQGAEIISMDGNFFANEPSLEDVPLITPQKHRPERSSSSDKCQDPATRDSNTTQEAHFTRSKALLDTELTPSPVRVAVSTPKRSSQRGARLDGNFLPWCGANRMRCWSPQQSKSSPDKSEKRVLEDSNVVFCKIESFLSSTISSETWMTSWQAWSFSRILQEIDEPRRYEKDMEKNVQRVLRNRAFRLNSKRKHLKNLRHDLNPFQEHAPLMARTLSFQPQATYSATKIRKEWGVNTTVNGRACHLDCTAMSVNKENEWTHDEPSDSICYDSDPEDFLRRPLRTLQLSGTTNKPSSRVEKPCYAPIDFTDEIAVKNAVRQAMNDQWTLILHEGSPIAVRMWIERGQNLPNSIIPPRLVYQQFHPGKQNNIQLQQRQLYGVDLLDIHRVLPIGKQSRLLGKSKCLLCIKVMKGEPIFLEAKSSSERDRIIRALKLVVASFGACLVTGGRDISEFFDNAQYGPGELPNILR